MPRTINIGAQGFVGLREQGCFYVDKTGFVRDWWGAADQVTLICRPRRFGKTLNLDTVRSFFSTEYANRGEELFGGLEVWDDRGLRDLQGTLPVIFLSFASVKPVGFSSMMERMRELIFRECSSWLQRIGWDRLEAGERALMERITLDMSDSVAASAINNLCAVLHRAYGARPLVLLDEYDTPMQEAWLGGWWDEASFFLRDLMNSTFKTNEHLGRGLITGVTRVSRESIFSDLNNLSIITTSTPRYQTCFGFTEQEVLAALGEYGLEAEWESVRSWYDGFQFGGEFDIYNPWSVCKFLDSGMYGTYWANTSSNSLVSSLIQRGDNRLKEDFVTLLGGREITKSFDEEVVFSELNRRPGAIWALLVASGYLKPTQPTPKFADKPRRLAITNFECQLSFDEMVKQWFSECDEAYGDFTRCLLAGDAEGMTESLSDVLLACAGSFDGGNRPSKKQPERFYHGLVLGMLVELRGRYAVESNRESGLGRYDVMLTPVAGAPESGPAIVIEFKLFDRKHGEKTLGDTVARAKAQIEERAYVAALLERGFAPERIRTYGMAFRGRECLVG